MHSRYILEPVNQPSWTISGSVTYTNIDNLEAEYPNIKPQWDVTQHVAQIPDWQRAVFNNGIARLEYTAENVNGYEGPSIVAFAAYGFDGNGISVAAQGNQYGLLASNTFYYTAKATFFM